MKLIVLNEHFKIVFIYSVHFQLFWNILSFILYDNFIFYLFLNVCYFNLLNFINLLFVVCFPLLHLIHIKKTNPNLLWGCYCLIFWMHLTNILLTLPPSSLYLGWWGGQWQNAYHCFIMFVNSALAAKTKTKYFS